MKRAVERHGVALKILAGLLVLTLFSVLGGTVAILSFRQANQALSQVASTQIKTMSDAAILRQHTQAIASLAPGLFARELDDGALLAFTTKMFSQQGELQRLIDQLSAEAGIHDDLKAIQDTAAAMFDNTDALSTAIYSKAALQSGIDQQIGELTAIRDQAHFLLASDDSAVAAPAIRRWLATLDTISATSLDSLAYKQPAGLMPLAADMTLKLREAAAASESAAVSTPKIRELQDRLAAVASGPEGFIARRSQLLETEQEIEILFGKSERIANKLATVVDAVAGGVQADVTRRSETLTATLTERSQLLLLLGGLGLASTLAIGAFTQMSVIGRLSRLRRAMIDAPAMAGTDQATDGSGTAGDALVDARRLANGGDEIAEMAHAVVSYVSEIGKRDEEITRSSQRLNAAIETLPSGFSLYDSDDNLVMCNSRYRQLLYPGIEGLVKIGQSFESILRTAIEHGLIRIADGDMAGWLANRVKSHRNPQEIALQHRGDGAWIEIRERRAESGDIVSIYTDITERKDFEAQLIDARARAEDAKELADGRSRMLENLSQKLSKYLSPQVYSSIFTSKSDVAISSARKKLTIFFADIANFAETTDSLESEELTDLLNDYLTEMSQIALQHGATIDKYIGDAIMVFFGDPETRGVQEDALACVTMAVAMQRRMRALEAVWRSRGIQRPFRMRIGINTGFCTVGNFGSADRMDYTIIGSEVNLAARLQAHAELGGILLAHETQALVNAAIPTEEMEPVAVKGFTHRIRIHRVLGIHDQIDGADNVIRAHLDGAELRIDLDRLSETDRTTLAGIARALIDRLRRQD